MSRNAFHLTLPQPSADQIVQSLFTALSTYYTNMYWFTTGTLQLIVTTVGGDVRRAVLAAHIPPPCTLAGSPEATVGTKQPDGFDELRFNIIFHLVQHFRINIAHRHFIAPQRCTLSSQSCASRDCTAPAAPLSKQGESHDGQDCALQRTHLGWMDLPTTQACFALHIQLYPLWDIKATDG